MKHPLATGNQKTLPAACRTAHPFTLAHSQWGREFGVTSAKPAILLALAGCLFLTGCGGILKPARSLERTFVLTPLPAEATKAAPEAIGVGVGQVKLPAYLEGKSLAVRKGANEIQYLPLALWGERLDHGFQRVLAANLSVLLPTDRVRLSAWRSGEVAAEVYVAIEQFDTDASGRGQLIARWRVLSPGGERTLKAGESRLTIQGPPPETDPAGAVAKLNDLVSQFSRQLAQALKETPLAARNNP